MVMRKGAPLVDLPLSEKEEEALRFIQKYQKKHGMPPTQQEVADAFGVRVSVMQGRLRGLMLKGRLTRDGRSPRTMRVLDA